MPTTKSSSEISSNKNIPIAVVHDFFVMHGGAEKVFYNIVEVVYKLQRNKKVNVYTLYKAQSFTFPKEIKEKIIIHERINSKLLRLLFKLVYERPHFFLSPIFKIIVVLLLPQLFGSIKFNNEKCILIDTSSFGVNIIPPPHSCTIAYIHTPFRALWGLDSTYLKGRSGFLRKILEKTIFKYLKSVNFWAFQRIHHLIANSEEVNNRIKKFFNREATVINPPVELDMTQKKHKIKPKEQFYLFINRLEKYKKIIDLVKYWPRNKQLYVAGTGSLYNTLQNLIKKQNLNNIKLLGYVSESQKWQLLRDAVAVIYPNREDFGIGIVEALSVGTPVIGYYKGGASEIIKHKKTGYLISEISTDLQKALNWIENSYTTPADILYNTARTYSPEQFKIKLTNVILHEKARYNKFISAN